MTTPEDAARELLKATLEMVADDGGYCVYTKDAEIVARALLAAEARIRVLGEALTDAANILENLANHVSQPALAICLVGDAKRFRAALAKPEETPT